MVVWEAAAGWVDTAVWVDTAGYGCRPCLSSWLSASWHGSSCKNASERIGVSITRAWLFPETNRPKSRLRSQWLESGQPEAFPTLHTVAIPEDFVRRIANFQQVLDRGR